MAFNTAARDGIVSICVTQRQMTSRMWDTIINTLRMWDTIGNTKSQQPEKILSNNCHRITNSTSANFTGKVK